jgi:hypothetical protein
MHLHGHDYDYSRDAFNNFITINSRRLFDFSHTDELLTPSTITTVVVPSREESVLSVLSELADTLYEDKQIQSKLIFNS